MASNVNIDSIDKAHHLQGSQPYLFFTPEEHSECLGLTYLSQGVSSLSLGQIHYIILWALKEEYAIRHEWRAYKFSHSTLQKATNLVGKFFLTVSDQCSKGLWH